MNRRLAGSGKAFTLVELLVVVAIIVVLMAMLLPALSKARESAVVASCGSNLKQMGNAMSMYNSENLDYYPDPIADGGWTQFSWQEKLTRYVTSNPDYWRDSPNPDYNFQSNGPGNINGVALAYWPDISARYSRPTLVDHSIFMDPIYANKTFAPPSGGAAWTSCYAFNQLILDNQGIPAWNSRGKAYKQTDLRQPIIIVGPNPVSMPGLGDFPWYLETMRHKSNIDCTQFLAYTNLMPAYPGGENYLWSDGHVDWNNASEYWLRNQHDGFSTDYHFQPVTQ